MSGRGGGERDRPAFAPGDTQEVSQKMSFGKKESCAHRLGSWKDQGKRRALTVVQTKTKNGTVLKRAPAEGSATKKENNWKIQES